MDSNQPCVELSEEECRRESLMAAVFAADNGIRAATWLWRTMTPAQRADWQAYVETCWPRADLMLKVLLPAGEKISEQEVKADEHSLRRPST
jgi:hypothetical protein